ncbi:hypothetical protein TL16_g00190 [Triparma laevis f. inornata]|uniref:Methyltransferase type 11 domain-containing protein n=1 Tax=Triparma laevis f. inornata TaxID=1714386 RepID=A0A9W7DRE2_9STRA|nr:hypothetical protein TL16_g00190 [Triparma laevis f. inornata]
MHRSLFLLFILPSSASLTICGIDAPNARSSPISRSLDNVEWPSEFPYTEDGLTPEWAGDDGAFYFLPKFVHHAGQECRDSLTAFYSSCLPTFGTGSTLDLCSSFTSHYPKGYKASRSVALGLNYLELLANPSKTEFRVQDLNKNPTLPYESNTFDVVTNSLSVDYLTSPLPLFSEIHRILKPNGYALMAFTNRCFPTKVVPIWKAPFTEENHVKIVASYFEFCEGEWEVGVADVSPSGWVGERDPSVVVVGRKK